MKFVKVSTNSGGRLVEEKVLVMRASYVEPENNNNITFEYDEHWKEEAYRRFNSTPTVNVPPYF